MQYGVEVFPYIRTNKQKSDPKGKRVVIKQKYKLLLLFLAAFLISRVSFINAMAPFGIAFLIGISVEKNTEASIFAACGTLVGYISIYMIIAEYIGLYFLLISSVVVFFYIFQNLKTKRKVLYLFLIIFVEIICYSYFVNKITIGMTFLTAASQVGCMFPIYFIMDYSIVCSKNLKDVHLISNEELISFIVTAALIISGTKNANILGASITNILALLLIIFISYVKGGTIGAAVGVAIGTIVGITSNNIIQYIGIYSICGLMAGVFKETGKWVTAAAFVISFFILKLYSGLGPQFKGAEIAISTGFFLAIPNSFYNKISLEFNKQKKEIFNYESSVTKVKELMVNKMEGFSDILQDMCYILGSLMDNDKLIMKNKSSSLVQNLADRVCGNCNMNSLCWKRENFYTYNALGELIQNYQENDFKVPEEIERKCIRRTAMVKSAEEIVNNFVICEMKRKSTIENRKLLARQIDSISSSLKEMVEKYNKDVNIDVEKEESIRTALDRNIINYKEIICVSDSKDRIKIRLKLEACNGRQKCIKDILPIVNKAVGRKLCVDDTGCNIYKEDESCMVTFEDMPKYYVATYVSGCCKDGEKHNGDSYCYEKLDDGTYMIVLGDGMGSGPDAEKESTASIKLVEKIVKAGFNNMSAISIVNSIMTLKFSTDEKYSTLDLCSIDLYSGDIEVMKVGAVQSFIKRGKEVEVINSRTLPIGVLDNPDVEVYSSSIKNGDVIVMVTDGILDFEGKCQNNTEWLIELLKENNNGSPRELGDEIIKKGKQLSGGKVKDDITVIVSKVYDLY